MPNIGAPELIIVGIILVLLFGATRLPATAKGLGQALRLFKKEIREDDEKKPEVTAAVQPVQQPVQPASVGQPVQAVQQQPVQQAPVQQAPVQQQPVQQAPVQSNGATAAPAPDQSAVQPGNQA
jgi:sec-independent protein translocase protein TatA